MCFQAEYQQMLADQRLRDRQLHTARHVNQITQMVARIHTGLTIIDITQIENQHAKLGLDSETTGVSV